ncbi:thermostable hemolysin [Hyphomonas sp.]|uniref:thermostable hemolysin n=1 Tax=Hyphomonas sp. TaxID=87 RepID=UPI003529B628
MATFSRLLENDASNDAQSVRSLIEGVYGNVYGAVLRDHYPEVCFHADDTGAIVAAAGVRRASAGLLFLESYLDSPIEDVIQRCVDETVSRDQIVEVGNLVSNQTGRCRFFFKLLCAELHTLGFRYVAATATRPLRRIFQYAGFQYRFLAAADPSRLKGGDAHWGSYYATDPHVVFGSVVDSHVSLKLHEMKGAA